MKRRSAKKTSTKSATRQANPWVKAVAQARKDLGITGFVSVKKGTEFHTLAKAHHARMKSPRTRSASPRRRSRSR